MMIALDTSIIIDLEKGKKETIERIREISSLHKSQGYIPFMSYLEFYYGIIGREVEKFEKAYLYLNKYPLLQNSKKTAEICAQIRKKYEKKGLTFSLSDLLIAAQVFENNLLLVTKDKDFERIDDVQKIIINY